MLKSFKNIFLKVKYIKEKKEYNLYIKRMNLLHPDYLNSVEDIKYYYSISDTLVKQSKRYSKDYYYSVKYNRGLLNALHKLDSKR